MGEEGEKGRLLSEHTIGVRVCIDHPKDPYIQGIYSPFHTAEKKKKKN